MGALIVVATSERIKRAADEMFAPMAKLTVDWMLRVLRGLPMAVFFMSLALAGTFQERWHERVATFEQENAELAADTRTVVLLGSSTMQGWESRDRTR